MKRPTCLCKRVILIFDDIPISDKFNPVLVRKMFKIYEKEI